MVQRRAQESHKEQSLPELPPYTATTKKEMTSSSTPAHSEARMIAVEKHWDKDRPWGWKSLDWFNVRYVYSSDTLSASKTSNVPENKRSQQGMWLAHLDFRVKNIPRLMRCGLHWSAENFILEKGYVCLNGKDMDANDKEGGYAHKSCYELQDVASDPQWTARLIVWFKTEEALTKFKTDNLCDDAVTYAQGLNWSQNLIYQYHSDASKASFNTIYGDMPLGGRWPWPKEQ